MSTVDAHPAGGGDVVQHDAARCQPLNCLRRVFDEATQQFRVVLVAAAFKAFLIEQLLAVMNALHALEAGFGGVHTGRGFNGVPADGRHFLDNQHARAFVVSLDRCRQTGAAAADNDHVHAAGFVRVDALFRGQRFAGFQHRFRDRFLHRFTLAGCAGDGIHVRGVGIQNAGTDLFKAGHKLNVFARAGGQLNVRNAVGFQTDVDHQFVSVILHFLSKGTRFEFGFAHAHVADHRFYQREAPQRFRNAELFAFGAVHKQLQAFPGRNAVCPVRISDGGAANGNQVVTVIQRLIHIGSIHHAAHAHDRNLRQRFRTHRAVFFDKRSWILSVDNGRTQGRADGEVQIVHAARRQFFQQVHGVVKADARDFHLFRGEAVANNKRVVRVLAHHFVGNVQHGQRELRAVIAAAAPLVIALV